MCLTHAFDFEHCMLALLCCMIADLCSDDHQCDSYIGSVIIRTGLWKPKINIRTLTHTWFDKLLVPFVGTQNSNNYVGCTCNADLRYVQD